ncbi:MAG TPA: PilZ domain-containing protein [Pyrinomonadaceae bacterium]|nr:PilZ domain-containing protein [Pyrinomonadaceae bacterium]
MYKFVVSCYYWPAGERRLRLRASIIKEQFADTGHGLDFARLGRSPSLDKIASSIERRRMRRLKTRCEIELMATLSLLDNDVQNCDSSLIFLGRTQDLSANGMCMVLPSTIIDERFCSGLNRLNLSLHVPGGVIGLEVSPVRCERLSGPYTGQGYLLGTKITNIDDPAKFEQYLDTLSGTRRQTIADN